MPTKLLAISGPLKRAEFPLGAHVVIGRDPNSAIHLDDPTVAPHHCEIAMEAGHLILSDSDSHSGTFVNGIPVKRRELHAGDEIAVGNSVFLLEAETHQNTAGSPVKLYEREVQRELRTMEFRPHELLSLEPDKLAALPRTARMARNLSALLQISRAIGSLRDEESLPWQFLGMIFDVIPAERGAILLFEDDTHEVRSQVAWDRKSGPDQPVHISQAIVHRVVQDRVSLLDSGAEAQQSSNEGAEAHNSRRSVLCVPMVSNEKVMGVIYLESSSAAAALTEDDFELLTAIAGLGVIGIENARQFEGLGRENQRLRAEVSLTHDMVGQSARMREVYQFIERVAPSDSTVLIYGESGTGKELAARAIHKNSPRKHQPFVALNCAALAENLLESELFGHEKGAFTSANCQKKGFLEVAEGGTIFLDEIGELSPVLQAKLLRVLQEREFLRVGGTRAIKINVRFLAATNKDLQKAVREETFRADLYHRLNVISIRLPSLAEHAEDIPSLAEHFTARHARNCNRKVTGISREALACLAQYDWPGNVRELANAMERAVVVGSSDTILAEDLPDIVHESAKTSGASSDRYHDAIRNLKKQLILSALEQSAGNVTEGAKLLGVHANYLHRLMRNFELRPSLKKQTGA